MAAVQAATYLLPPGEIGALAAQLLPYQAVIACDDEERQLRDVVGPRDLDGARCEAGLSEQKRFRVERAHEDVRRRAVAHDDAGHGRDVRELLGRDEAHAAGIVL